MATTVTTTSTTGTSGASQASTGSGQRDATCKAPAEPGRSRLETAMEAARVVADNARYLTKAAPRMLKVLKTTSWKKGLEYPVMVAIETTNRCNATCWFCPITEGSERPPEDKEELVQLTQRKLKMKKVQASNEERAEAAANGHKLVPDDQADGSDQSQKVTFNMMKRPLGYMSDDLFHKIIEDCKEFPLRRIEPYLHGEPFMDKKIFERIEYINKHLPDTEVHIFTNGSLLTRKAVEKLQELNLHSLLISLNTAEEEKYRAIMGLSWKKTLNNIQRVADANRSSKKVATRFIIRMTAPEETSDAEVKRFKKMARSMGARPVVATLHNYKGDIHTERPVPQYPCYFIRDLDILWDGKTALCCMDHDGDYSWGDVNEHSVLEVFNSAQARMYKEAMRQDRRSEIEPCNTCNMFWWNFGYTGIRRPLYAARLGKYLLTHKPVRM